MIRISNSKSKRRDPIFWEDRISKIGFFLLFFYPFIEPTKKLTLPENTVLGFGYPMAFVGEEQKFTWNTSQLRCIKSLKAFGIWYPEIICTGNDHDGCIPFIHIQMRRKAGETFRLRFVPKMSSQVVVGEEKFFRRG